MLKKKRERERDEYIYIYTSQQKDTKEGKEKGYRNRNPHLNISTWNQKSKKKSNRKRRRERERRSSLLSRDPKWFLRRPPLAHVLHQFHDLWPGSWRFPHSGRAGGIFLLDFFLFLSFQLDSFHLMPLIRFFWIGLDWIGLDWIGLDGGIESWKWTGNAADGITIRLNSPSWLDDASRDVSMRPTWRGSAT